MRHPVLIYDAPHNTALRVELTDWLAENDLPPDVPVMALIYDGIFLIEWLYADTLQPRRWPVKTPMPLGLLGQLAAKHALGCTAVHPGTGERPIRCAWPVDSAGRHPGRHAPAEPSGTLDEQGWTIQNLPSHAEQRRRAPRRRAVIHIGEDRLNDLLRLPEGQCVIGFNPQFLTLGIDVHIEGDGLPEVPSAGEPPRIGRRYFSALYVGATDPAGIHAGVLAALADVTHLEGHRSYEARLRQLERHAPTEGILREAGDYSDARCSTCIEEDMNVPWPCDDYRDSAAPVTVAAWLTPTPWPDLDPA